MNAYPLQDMVRVRRHREEQAGQAVARARRLLHEARAAVLKAAQELAAYAEWRVLEERRRLDGLMRRILRLGELSDVRQEIALLREREFEFVDRRKQAEAAVTAAEARLEDSRQSHALTVRELEKLVEHRTLWVLEITRAQERAEDLELEEFGAPRNHAGRD